MLKIIEKYPYTELKRSTVNGKRLYENPWGEPVPSVTTILDRTKPKEKVEILNNWKKRVGEKEAARIVSEAANVGTQMHAILEYWLKNQEYSGDTTLQSQIMADTVKKNVETHLEEVWGSEVNLCYPGLYAGTTDLVGIWKGKPSILDFKQTNKPKKREWIDDYFLQLTAYGLAHNELYATNISNGAIFMCSRDCEFQLFELNEEDWKKYSHIWSKRVEEFYNL